MKRTIISLLFLLLSLPGQGEEDFKIFNFVLTRQLSPSHLIDEYKIECNRFECKLNRGGVSKTHPRKALEPHIQELMKNTPSISRKAKQSNYKLKWNIQYGNLKIENYFQLDGSLPPSSVLDFEEKTSSFSFKVGQ